VPLKLALSAKRRGQAYGTKHFKAIPSPNTTAQSSIVTSANSLAGRANSGSSDHVLAHWSAPGRSRASSKATVWTSARSRSGAAASHDRQGIGPAAARRSENPGDPSSARRDLNRHAWHHVLVRQDAVPRAHGRRGAGEITGPHCPHLEKVEGQIVGTFDHAIASVRQFTYSQTCWAGGQLVRTDVCRYGRVVDDKKNCPAALQVPTIWLRAFSRMRTMPGNFASPAPAMGAPGRHPLPERGHERHAWLLFEVASCGTRIAGVSIVWLQQAIP